MKSKLHESYELQQLNTTVRDLVSWCIDMTRLVTSDEPVHDVTDAETILTNLEEYKAEIEAREEIFSNAVEQGERMIEDGHYASDEITEKLEFLLTERETLHGSWENQKNQYDQVYELQVFLRDAKLIDSSTSSQEVVLAGAELGSTVDEVDTLLKKHENMEKLTFAQEERVTALCEFADELVANEHFASESIKDRLQNVVERRGKLQDDLVERRNKLEDSKRLAQFYQDVVEAEAWITEKLQTASDESFKDPTNLKGKLKKHRAFDAEITAHEESIDSVRRNGEALIEGGHYDSEEIENRIEIMFNLWEELLLATANKTRGLEEARDHQKFNQEVDIAESCIHDKEAIVSSEEYGRDYEHCSLLQKKMDEFDKDLAVDIARVETINELADKLIAQCHAGAPLIYERQQALNEKWNNFQTLTDERRHRLADALEIHAFDKKCNEANDRIHEKIILLSVDDLGKDVSSTEALLRKHDELERGLTVIEGNLVNLDEEAHRLVQEQPGMSAHVQAKQTEIIQSWEQLSDLADARKEKLEANRLLQLFLVDYRDLMSWMTDLYNRMMAGDMAKNVKEAEALLELHEERKGEMDARSEMFLAVQEFGQSLLSQQHFAEDDINSRLVELETEKNQLYECWQEQLHLLNQSYDLQIFLHEAEEADSWMGTKETFLTAEELGDSLSVVESFIKHHEDFEKSLSAYDEKIKIIVQTAQQLVDSEHYESSLIASRSGMVQDKWERLKELAVRKKHDLEEARLYQHFLQNAKEVENWMKERMQVASDSSYREATNLQQKLQKHQAFEAELTANKERLNLVMQEGTNLIRKKHSCSGKIEQRLKELETLWMKLAEHSSDKSQKLQEAIQRQQFDINVKDIETWLHEIEKALSNDDLGKDLNSVNNLIKKHQLLEADVVLHQDRIGTIVEQAKEFIEADHFQKNEIHTKAQALVERFDKLAEPATLRNDQLQESLLLQQFLRDVEDELSWIKEKQPSASSEEYGDSLTAVQSLLKKHDGIETELSTHEQLINSVVNTSSQLISQKHYAAETIQQCSEQLQLCWNQLRDLSSQRRQKLQEALAAQEYFSEVNEVESWMKDKLHIVSSDDCGKDEDGAQAFLRNHEALLMDIESYKTKVQHLRAQCESLCENNHYDSDRILSKQVDIEQQFGELAELGLLRQSRLVEAIKLYHFLREADELETWMKENEDTAKSEDYGNDLEHVEFLLKKFEDFARDLLASEERVTMLNHIAQALLDEEHSDSELIEKVVLDICQKWDTLKEITNNRLEKLDASKEIHSFDRTAEETESWIQEKEAVLTFCEEDMGKDLASVQSLARQHEVFERDLDALSERVDVVSQEAILLSESYPENIDYLQERKETTEAALRKIREKSARRKQKLKDSQSLHKFLNECKDFSSWMSSMKSLISSNNQATDVTSVQAAGTRHQEHKAEIDTRLNTLEAINQSALELVEGGHYASEEIEEKAEKLTLMWEELVQLWQEHEQTLANSMDMHMFYREADQLEAWLSARESVLENDDLGDSLEAVEELLKKQDEFENMLLAQEEKFQSLRKATLCEEDLRKSDEEEEEKLIRVLEEEKEMERRLELDKITEKLEDERKKREEANLKREAEKQRKLEMEKEKAVEKERTSWEESTSRDTTVDASLAEESPQITVTVPDVSSVPDDDTQDEIVVTVSPPSPPQQSPPSVKKTNNLSKVQPSTTAIITEGLLQRKQELEAGGKKAHARSWRSLYSVLMGQKIMFYKDKKEYQQHVPASSSVSIAGASCDVASEYAKKKNALRLSLADGSEYLFSARDQWDMKDWIRKINTQAGNAVSPVNGQFTEDDLDIIPPPPPPVTDTLLNRENSVTSEDSVITENGIPVLDEDPLPDLPSIPPPDVPAFDDNFEVDQSLEEGSHLIIVPEVIISEYQTPTASDSDNANSSDSTPTPRRKNQAPTPPSDPSPIHSTQTTPDYNQNISDSRKSSLDSAEIRDPPPLKPLSKQQTFEPKTQAKTEASPVDRFSKRHAPLPPSAGTSAVPWSGGGRVAMGTNLRSTGANHNDGSDDKKHDKKKAGLKLGGIFKKKW